MTPQQIQEEAERRYPSTYAENRRNGFIEGAIWVANSYKDNVRETLYSHYKKTGGFTNTAAKFIEKIAGEKWERDKEIDELIDENKRLKQQLESNQWIKCSDRLPTKEDNENCELLGWDSISGRSEFYTWNYIIDRPYITHWRTIVPPSE